MIKIVHVITALGSGGAESMLVRVATQGDHKAFEHLVVSLTDEGMQGSILRQHGVRVVALGMKRGVPDIRGLLRLRRLLAQEKPQVVQTWLYHADLLGLVAGKLAGISVIGWNIRCSNMELQHFARLTRAVRGTLALCSRFASFAIVNSVAGKEYHERLGFHPRRWELIFNGFDLNEFRPDAEARGAVRAELGVRDDAKLVGMMARFDPMKDFATFFEAAAIVSRTSPETHFVLAGSGIDNANNTLRTLIESANLDNVHLLGFRSDVKRLMAACDVFTLSSHGEGFPNVVGEAMSCGVPCVVTDVGDSAFVVGETGRIVPLRDPNALAAAWKELLSLDLRDRQALGSRARERIHENFDLRSMVARYEKTYAAFVEAHAS
jgi:glycosyltransferase involved in cell wall biosynthesis